jgi:hypothetical protein
MNTARICYFILALAQMIRNSIVGYHILSIRACRSYGTVNFLWDKRILQSVHFAVRKSSSEVERASTDSGPPKKKFKISKIIIPPQRRSFSSGVNKDSSSSSKTTTVVNLPSTSSSPPKKISETSKSNNTTSKSPQQQERQLHQHIYNKTVSKTGAFIKSWPNIYDAAHHYQRAHKITLAGIRLDPTIKNGRNQQRKFSAQFIDSLMQELTKPITEYMKLYTKGFRELHPFEVEYFWNILMFISFVKLLFLLRQQLLISRSQPGPNKVFRIFPLFSIT